MEPLLEGRWPNTSWRASGERRGEAVVWLSVARGRLVWRAALRTVVLVSRMGRREVGSVVSSMCRRWAGMEKRGVGVVL